MDISLRTGFQIVLSEEEFEMITEALKCWLEAAPDAGDSVKKMAVAQAMMVRIQDWMEK